MAELKFSITNDHIKLERLSVAPVSDSINHLYASFDFDSAWDGCVKTAIFSGSGKVYHVILPDDNRCVIPWEVLTGARFAVSAFGTKDDFRITATELTIPLDKAGLKCAQTPSEPSDSAYTQLLQLLSWAVVNRAALEKFAEGSTDVPNMINIRDGVTLAQELAAKANKTELAAKADKSYNSGFIGGTGAKLNGAGGTATGQNAQASSGAAAGQNAQASEGVAAGKNAYASHGASLGRDTKTLHGVAAGDGAQTVDEDGNPITAIQLGGGTNTEPNTAKFFDYTVMNADGTIPAGRLSNYYTKANVDTKLGDLQTDMADKIGKYDEISVEISSGVETVSTAWEALKSGLRADELLSSKVNKSDVYTKTQIDTKLGDKSDKPTVTDYLESGSVLSVTMTDNNIATCPEVSTLSITMPTSHDVAYCSELSFSSGTTPTSLTYPENVVMIGMDCIDNVFAPVANKRYTLMTTYNGQSFVGYVSGYEVSA